MKKEPLAVMPAQRGSNKVSIVQPLDTRICAEMPDRVRTRAEKIFMLVWLIALPCLLSASLAPGVLPNDVVVVILSKFGFGGLHQMACVSKEYCRLCLRIGKALYGIEHNGKTYLNYSKILYELDALAGEATDEDTGSFGTDPRCVYSQFILELEFGYCIKYGKEGLPKFCLNDVYFEILNDKHKITVLPYILDKMLKNGVWLHFIRGLVDRGRWDLLEQMAFANMSTSKFCKMLTVSTPVPIRMAMIGSLQDNEPNSELPSQLALAEHGHEAAPPARSSTLPLFFLRRLHEKGHPVPKGLVFTGGLSKHSIIFWTYLLEMEVHKAERLLKLILEQGDADTRRLARALSEPVPNGGPEYAGNDVYQALLTRFRFSPLCNERIIQRHKAVLGSQLRIGYCTVCAYVDCQQYELASKYALNTISDIDLESLIDRTYRLENDAAHALCRKLIEQYEDAARLFQRLIKKRDLDDTYVQLVWESIQAKSFRWIDDYNCSLPVATLKRLALEPDISAEAVEQMLGGLPGFSLMGEVVSKEVHALYMAMFWETPEPVVEHLLDQVPKDCKLRHKRIWRLLWSKEYSDAFCAKAIRRFGKTGFNWQAALLEFRPDLAKELFQNEKSGWNSTE